MLDVLVLVLLLQDLHRHSRCSLPIKLNFYLLDFMSKNMFFLSNWFHLLTERDINFPHFCQMFRRMVGWFYFVVTCHRVDLNGDEMVQLYIFISALLVFIKVNLQTLKGHSDPCCSRSHWTLLFPVFLWMEENCFFLASFLFGVARDKNLILLLTHLT